MPHVSNPFRSPESKRELRLDGNSHVVQKFVRPAHILELLERELSNDSAKLPARGRDSVRRRAIASRKRFPRDDESCSIRAEILEEICETVEHDEGDLASRRLHQLVIRKACNPVRTLHEYICDRTHP